MRVHCRMRFQLRNEHYSRPINSQSVIKNDHRRAGSTPSKRAASKIRAAVQLFPYGVGQYRGSSQTHIPLFATLHCV